MPQILHIFLSDPGTPLRAFGLSPHIPAPVSRTSGYWIHIRPDRGTAHDRKIQKFQFPWKSLPQYILSPYHRHAGTSMYVHDNLLLKNPFCCPSSVYSPIILTWNTFYDNKRPCASSHAHTVFYYFKYSNKLLPIV